MFVQIAVSSLYGTAVPKWAYYVYEGLTYHLCTEGLHVLVRWPQINKECGVSMKLNKPRMKKVLYVGMCFNATKTAYIICGRLSLWSQYIRGQHEYRQWTYVNVIMTHVTIYMCKTDKGTTHM